MELIASFLFYFLGIRALFRLPRYKEGKHRLRRWLLDGACKGFFYTMAVVAFVYLVTWMQGGVLVTPQELVVGGGSGIILGFVTSIYGLLKYWNKKDKGREIKKTKKPREEEWEDAEGTGEERTMTEKIRATRNQIQREIQRKKMEGQRMMNDSYLKPEVKRRLASGIRIVFGCYKSFMRRRVMSWPIWRRMDPISELILTHSMFLSRGRENCRSR